MASAGKMADTSDKPDDENVTADGGGVDKAPSSEPTTTTTRAPATAVADEDESDWEELDGMFSFRKS
jgi:hypothetical protein